jgi:hypothetical protein
MIRDHKYFLMFALEAVLKKGLGHGYDDFSPFSIVNSQIPD